MENQSLSQEGNTRNGTGQTSNLPHRIWKYKLHYLIVLPALFFIFIFKVIPFLFGLYLSFVDFNIIKGLFNSPWVGTANFTKLFTDPLFRTVLANTLIIKLSYIAACGVTALVLVLLISMISSQRMKNLFATIFLIPYFIPAAVFAYLALLILSPDHSPVVQIESFVWADQSWFRSLLVATEVIQTCGIPIIIALAAIASKQTALEQSGRGNRGFLHSHVIPALKAITAFMLMQFSTLLSINQELVGQLVHPLVYDVGDTIDSFYFRSSFMNADYSYASPLWLIQFVVQLVFTILAYFLIRGIFVQDLFSHYDSKVKLQATPHKGGNWLGIIGSLIGALIVLLFVYVLFIYPFTVSSESGVGLSTLVSKHSFIVHGSFDLAAVIINLPLTLTLAYPLTVKDFPGRGFYKMFLLFILAMGASIAIPDFMMAKNLHLVNTIFPLTFSGFISILNVFVLKSLFNSKHALLKEQASAEGRGELYTFFNLFIPKVWKPLIAMGILQFVSLWNSYYPSLIFTLRQDMYTPIMKFVSLIQAAPDGGRPSVPVMLEFGAIISLPSILLLILFRRWLTAEVFIGQSRKL